MLAHHWEAAGEALEAARWHRRAAEWIGSKDRRESTRHWKTVCALLEGLPTTPETAEIGAQARYRRLLNAVYLGQPDDEQHRLFAEGRALAVEHGSAQQVVLMSLSYAVARVFAGAVRDGVRELREAIRMADESGDPTMRFVARAALVNPLHFSGRLREALALSAEALALSGGDARLGTDVLGFSPYTSVVLIRSLLLTRMGDLETGARELARGRELARTLDDAEALGTSHVFAIICAQMSGRVERVLDDARVALEIAERRGSPFFRAGAHSALGYAYGLVGQWAAGARALEHALAIVAERRTGAQIEPSWLASLTDVYRELGELERAAVTAERALELARDRGTDVWCIEALLALARVQRAVGRDGLEIDALLDEAAVLVDSTGALSLAPLIELARAEVAGVRGDAAARRRVLERAQRGFASMGATAHAERVARLLA
jgi:adenylate cyclase